MAFMILGVDLGGGSQERYHLRLIGLRLRRACGGGRSNMERRLAILVDQRGVRLAREQFLDQLKIAFACGQVERAIAFLIHGIDVLVERLVDHATVAVMPLLLRHVEAQLLNIVFGQRTGWGQGLALVVLQAQSGGA